MKSDLLSFVYNYKSLTITNEKQFNIVSFIINFDKILFPFVEPTFMFYTNKFPVDNHSKLFND